MEILEKLVNGAKNMLLAGAACFIPGLMNLDAQAQQTNDSNWEVRYHFKVKDLDGNERAAVGPGSTNVLEFWADKPAPTECTTIALGSEFDMPKELKLIKAINPEEYGAEDIFYGFEKSDYSIVKSFGSWGQFGRSVAGKYPRIGIDTGNGVVAKYEFVVSPELTNDFQICNLQLHRYVGADYDKPGIGTQYHRVAQKSLPLVVYKDPDASFSYLLTDKHDGNKEHPVDDYLDYWGSVHTPVQSHFSIKSIVNNMPLMQHKLQKASNLDGSWTDVPGASYYTGTDVGGCHSFDCTPNDNRMSENSEAVGSKFYRIESSPSSEGFRK